MHPCRRVGLDFFDSAPFRVTNSTELPIAAAQLFEVLTDVQAWPRWFAVITDAQWTSPAPHRAGSTRRITTRRGLEAVEEFIAWTPHSHLAFRLNESTNPRAGASAEQYRIESTERGCKLTWTVAEDPIDPPWWARRTGRFAMNHVYRKALKDLRSYTDQRFGFSV